MCARSFFLARLYSVLVWSGLSFSKRASDGVRLPAPSMPMAERVSPGAEVGQ